MDADRNYAEWNKCQMACYVLEEFGQLHSLLANMVANKNHLE